MVIFNQRGFAASNSSFFFKYKYINILIKSRACLRRCHNFSSKHEILAIGIFLKDFIYLFDREKSQVDGEAGREREREVGSLLSREPHVGLDPSTLRS